MAIVMSQITRQGKAGRGLGGVARRRGGMTLVEVLVAMVVLLVGIWGVARGFPMLMRSIREEGRRGQMTQLARETLERLLADPAGVAQLTSGGPNIAPQMAPQDPDSVALAGNPPNARDEWTHVVNEPATVPSLPAGAVAGTPVSYALKLGRANPASLPAVSQVTPLTALPSPPPDLPNMPDSCFYLDPYGTVTADPNVWIVPGWPPVPELLEISYAWLDTSRTTHWVQREQVPLSGGTGTVAAAGASGFDTAVEGSAWGNALTAFVVQPTGSTPGPGEVSMDPLGATLLFNAADSGRSVEISYDLAVEVPGGRRAQEIFEDQVLSEAAIIPNDPSPPGFNEVKVQLTATGLNNETVLNSNDPATADPANLNTHVLAVDLATGARYWEGGADVTGGGIDPNSGIDYVKGTVTVRVPNGGGGSPDPNARALGHTFRFFYKTLDQAMLTVMRAPEFYLPADLFGATNPVQRFAQAVNGGYMVLDFTTGTDPVTGPTSVSAGNMVAVDYTYGDPNDPQRAVGELHTINIRARQITLNNPDVLSIIAVRGVSLKVRAWWRSQTGRLQYVDVDNLVSPVPAG